MNIKEWPEGERPREKLLERGAAALSGTELLVVLLCVGACGMNAVDLVRHLLSELGSLGRLMGADVKTLSVYKGMDLASYTWFAVVKEIGWWILGEDLQEQMVLSNPKPVTDYLRLYLGYEKIEVSVALLPNHQNQLVVVRESSCGTMAENTAYICEVIKLALDEYVDSLILTHNHSGGLARPSESDVQFTERSKQALNLMDITLLDHFIVTVKEACSLREQGYM